MFIGPTEMLQKRWTTILWLLKKRATSSNDRFTFSSSLPSITRSRGCLLFFSEILDIYIYALDRFISIIWGTFGLTFFDDPSTSYFFDDSPSYIFGWETDDGLLSSIETAFGFKIQCLVLSLNGLLGCLIAILVTCPSWSNIIQTYQLAFLTLILDQSLFWLLGYTLQCLAWYALGKRQGLINPNGKKRSLFLNGTFFLDWELKRFQR